MSSVNMIYVPAGTPGTRELIEWAVTDPFTVRQSAFVDIEIVSREGTTTDVAPVVEIPIGALVHIVPPQGFFDEVGVLGLRIERIGILGEVTELIEGASILDVITVLGNPSGVGYLAINTEVLAYGTYRLLVPFGGGEIVVPFLVKEGVE